MNAQIKGERHVAIEKLQYVSRKNERLEEYLENLKINFEIVVRSHAVCINSSR